MCAILVIFGTLNTLARACVCVLARVQIGVIVACVNHYLFCFRTFFPEFSILQTLLK